MIYLIDAYNYIAYVTGHKVSAQRQIKSILVTIEKSLSVQSDQGIVVFDGGVLPYQEKSQIGSCTIIYPGIGRTADSYLLDSMPNYAPGHACVVTADREIIAGARAHGHRIMRPYEFQKLLQERLALAKPSKKNRSGVIKYNNYQANGEVDKIMQEAALGRMSHDQDDDTGVDS